MMEKKYDELRIDRLLNLAGYSNLKSVANIRYILTNYMVLKKCEPLRGTGCYDIAVESISKHNECVLESLLCMLDVMINKCMSEIDSISCMTGFVDTLRRLFPMNDTDNIPSVDEVAK